MTGEACAASFRFVNIANLIQLAVSAVAVALLVGLAALMTRGLGAPPLDEAAARRGLAEEFPGAPIDGLWLAADGRGAVARSGDRALVLSRMGDGYVARQVAWTVAAGAAVRDGKVHIALRDPGAPRVVLAFPAWPPKELAA